jgi:hypothetical protein
VTATIIPLFDTRSEKVVVSRSALSAAGENGVASTKLATDALERAVDHIFHGDRAAAINAIGRAAFEIQERLPNLLTLTKLAEEAPAWCPDETAAPGHGRAA